MNTLRQSNHWIRRKDTLGSLALVLFLGTLPLWLNTPYALSTKV
jgi:hypothetical protein